MIYCTSSNYELHKGLFHIVIYGYNFRLFSGKLECMSITAILNTGPRRALTRVVVALGDGVESE